VSGEPRDGLIFRAYQTVAPNDYYDFTRCPEGEKVTRLNSARGHTLVELMAGMVILLLVVAGAFSFFIFQSVEGFEVFRIKRVEEAVSLTQAVILRDILEAGSGLMDHPYLSVYISSGATSSDNDTLYISHSGFLTMEMTPTSLSGAAAEATNEYHQRTGGIMRPP